MITLDEFEMTGRVYGVPKGSLVEMIVPDNLFIDGDTHWLKTGHILANNEGYPDLPEKATTITITRNESYDFQHNRTETNIHGYVWWNMHNSHFIGASTPSNRGFRFNAAGGFMALYSYGNYVESIKGFSTNGAFLFVLDGNGRRIYKRELATAGSRHNIPSDVTGTPLSILALDDKVLVLGDEEFGIRHVSYSLGTWFHKESIVPFNGTLKVLVKNSAGIWGISTDKKLHYMGNSGVYTGRYVDIPFDGELNVIDADFKDDGKLLIMAGSEEKVYGFDLTATIGGFGYDAMLGLSGIPYYIRIK